MIFLLDVISSSTRHKSHTVWSVSTLHSLNRHQAVTAYPVIKNRSVSIFLEYLS